ncbi:metal regulatory transcription factor 1 [Hydra vulgaris]|uniref:Metal regulatory transcription factor 1 n=1 Tax=Hydra vulgaris TaxID=6087 RepID=A0ABM4BHR5_HYDVU
MEDFHTTARWFLPTFQPSNNVLSPLITYRNYNEKESFANDVPSIQELQSLLGANGYHDRFLPTKVNYSLDSLKLLPCLHVDIPDEKNNFDMAKTRGRPSTHTLQKLCLENVHRHKCPDCHRSFPRKKSLDTHLLTHSNIKPYICDYPGCTRKFKQSGQLKTHLRLHTGEKPFQCSFPSCTVSFTHANRKCPRHPMHPLYRVTGLAIQKQLLDNSRLQNKTLKHPYRDKLIDCFSNSHVLKANDNELTDEDQKRMLSAVALVELQAQSHFFINSNNKENE